MSESRYTDEFREYFKKYWGRYPEEAVARPTELPEASRGFREYSLLLFPEDSPQIIAGHVLNRLSKKEPQPPFSHFVVREEQTAQEVLSLTEVKAKLGGKKGFFTSGSKILDIGSGAGKAVKELGEHYRKVEIVGLDPLYKTETPISKEGLYVAGRWYALPFKKNTFDGILTCESFPRHAPNDISSPEYTSTIKEITRVSKPNAIWRSTLFPTFYDAFQPGYTEAKRLGLVNIMLENGWEVYINERVMIAKLANKKS